MSEKLLLKKLAAPALVIGALAANGCGINDTNENTFNIAITCPDSTDLDVTAINNNRSGNDEVTITCTGAESSNVAPSDIQILSGSEGAIIGDQEITDVLQVKTKTYGGGKGRFGSSQIDTSSEFATLSFDVGNIEEVMVNSDQSTPAPTEG